jgi:hypothetical protein
MLAASPESILLGYRGKRFSGDREWVVGRVVIVDGGLIAPACGVGDGPGLHFGNGAGVPE